MHLQLRAIISNSMYIQSQKNHDHENKLEIEFVFVIIVTKVRRYRNFAWSLHEKNFSGHKNPRNGRTPMKFSLNDYVFVTNCLIAYLS